MSEKLGEIKRRLGEPFFEVPGFLLYQMDCFDGMRALGNFGVNLTVTSPPYNIGKEYEDRKPLDEYVKWTEEWVRLVFELSAPNGALCLNLGYVEVPGRGKAVPLPYLLWDRTPFYLLQEIIWHYGAGVAARKSLSPRNEKILWYVRDSEDYVFELDSIRDPNVKYPRQFKNGKLKVNPAGKNPTDVWILPKVTSGTNRSSVERTPHPAQFPEALIDRIVKGMSQAHDVVLDPFMGSGTTAVVALQNERECVGFEQNADYCSLAAQRVETWCRRGYQPDLLAEASSTGRA